MRIEVDGDNLKYVFLDAPDPTHDDLQVDHVFPLLPLCRQEVQKDTHEATVGQVLFDGRTRMIHCEEGSGSEEVAKWMQKADGQVEKCGREAHVGEAASEPVRSSLRWEVEELADAITDSSAVLIAHEKVL
jgi:hypothetical protein